MNSTYETIIPNPEQDVIITLINEEALKNTPYLNYTSACIPAHWHRSIEFTLIRKGHVKLNINNQIKHLHDNDFIFVNSSQVHQIESDDYQDGEVLMLIIPYDILKKTIPDIDNISFDIYRDSTYHPYFYEAFNFFYEHLSSPQKYDRLKIDACVFNLLYLLVNHYRVEQSGKAYRTSRKMQHDLLNYIENHFFEDLSLIDLADAFHLNPEYLSRLFKQLFGLNFKSYLTNYRLNMSLNDILHSDKGIQDIASEYGFPSVKSYISAFKDYYHETPYRYRLIKKENQK